MRNVEGEGRREAKVARYLTLVSNTELALALGPEPHLPTCRRPSVVARRKGAKRLIHTMNNCIYARRRTSTSTSTARNPATCTEYWWPSRCHGHLLAFEGQQTAYCVVGPGPSFNLNLLQMPRKRFASGANFIFISRNNQYWNDGRRF